MHHIAVQRRCRTILRKQCDLSGLLAALVKRFNCLTPRRSLCVVDLAQIQHMPLHCPTAGHPAVFHDAPVAVLLAVLPANLVAQKHDRRLSKHAAVSQDTWSAPQAVSAVSRMLTLGFSVTYRHLAGAKFLKPWSSCESRVSAAKQSPAGWAPGPTTPFNRLPGPADRGRSLRFPRDDRVSLTDRLGQPHAITAVILAQRHDEFDRLLPISRGQRLGAPPGGGACRAAAAEDDPGSHQLDARMVSGGRGQALVAREQDSVERFGKCDIGRR